MRLFPRRGVVYFCAMRTEHDTLGQKEVPGDALSGIHTQRALENFGVSGRRVRLTPSSA